MSNSVNLQYTMWQSGEMESKTGNRDQITKSKKNPNNCKKLHEYLPENVAKWTSVF